MDVPPRYGVAGRPLYKKKGASPSLTMPPVFAGDPAPQQLTAPCRKYSGRLHHPTEQPVYRPHFPDLAGICRGAPERQRPRCDGTVRAITDLIAVMVLTAATAVAQVPAGSTISGVIIDARTGSPLPQVPEHPWSEAQRR